MEPEPIRNLRSYITSLRAVRKYGVEANSLCPDPRMADLLDLVAQLETRAAVRLLKANQEEEKQG